MNAKLLINQLHTLFNKVWFVCWECDVIRATCQVCCQTLWRWVICCKGENPKSYESIEHQSIKQVLADPLTNGLPPKWTWVLWEAYDFWITKGPRKKLRSCFNTERCIVVVNLTVIDNRHDKARPTYWSAMRWGPRAKKHKESKKVYVKV